VRSNSVDFIDEVFNSLNSTLAQNFFNGVVGFKGNSLPLDFTIASLEDKSSDGFSGGIPVCDVGFNSSEHIDGGFVDSDENSVVELSQSEESHDSNDLGVEFINTSDSNNKGKFGFGGYVNLSSVLSLNKSELTFLLALISAQQAFL